MEISNKYYNALMKYISISQDFSLDICFILGEQVLSDKEKIKKIRDYWQEAGSKKKKYWNIIEKNLLILSKKA